MFRVGLACIVVLVVLCIVLVWLFSRWGFRIVLFGSCICRLRGVLFGWLFVGRIFLGWS